MSALTPAQVSFFQDNGYLVLEDAVSAQQLDALRADMAAWCEESRSHRSNYGETINGKPRFDLDPSHSEGHPALRRVNAPVEVSQAHLQAATDSVMCVYSSEDAVPLSPNPMPSRYEGQLVRGERSGRVRSVEFQLRLPQLPPGASFFEQQGAGAPPP